MTNFAVDVVDRQARQPERVAIAWHVPDAVPLFITFHDLKLRSDKVAQVLYDHGVRYGDHVLILLPLRPEWWESILGCMKIGAVAVLGEDIPTAERFIHGLNAFRASTLIANMAIAEQVEAIVARTPVSCRIGVGWEREGWVDYDRRVSLATRQFDPVPTRPDDPCLVLLPDDIHSSPVTFCHGDERFDLDLLDAWRKGDTIEAYARAAP